MEVLKRKKEKGLSGRHQPRSPAGKNEEKQASFAFFFFIANMKHK